MKSGSKLPYIPISTISQPLLLVTYTHHSDILKYLPVASAFLVWVDWWIVMSVWCAWKRWCALLHFANIPLSHVPLLVY